jgi:hypothetical protein
MLAMLQTNRPPSLSPGATIREKPSLPRAQFEAIARFKSRPEQSAKPFLLPGKYLPPNANSGWKELPRAALTVTQEAAGQLRGAGGR